MNQAKTLLLTLGATWFTLGFCFVFAPVFFGSMMISSPNLSDESALLIQVLGSVFVLISSFSCSLIPTKAVIEAGSQGLLIGSALTLYSLYCYSKFSSYLLYGSIIMYGGVGIALRFCPAVDTKKQ